MVLLACTICDEPFHGIHQDSIYTTLCGHIFHYNCLKTWLNRSYSCPNCRTILSGEHLIKLFLQFQTPVNHTNLQINTLNNQVNHFREKNNQYETQINQLKSKINENNISIGDLNHELNSDKLKIIKLKNKLRENKTNYTMLLEEREENKSKLSLEKLKNKTLEINLYDLQSFNSVTINKLKIEIAGLKAEKAYFQSKCYNSENAIYELQSTSKGNIDNETFTSPALQIENAFNGQDPCLNSTANNFLLGCVFLFANDQYYIQFRSMCIDKIMSENNIIEHGGEIALSYSSHVTHIICDTQDNSLVRQGILDKKRCVTKYWLSDVIAKKEMSPPWLSCHFPLPYSENSLPCKQFQICIDNFDPNDYIKVKVMVELIGACIVNTVSSNTDILVSLKLEGQMVRQAFDLNKPVVNVQWLNDIILGANNSIQNPKNIKYKQFDLLDPFLVNYDMVSHLMESWKVPVLILKNEEVNDLTESSANLAKRRKQNTISNVGIPEMINLADDDDDDDVIINFGGVDIEIQIRKKPRVMFSGFTMVERKKYEKIVLKLGGKIANKNEGTHLIMKNNIKSLKFLCCISNVSQIVYEEWLIISHTLSSFQDERKYYVKEICEDMSGHIVCNISQVLKNSRRSKLFEKMTFFITLGLRNNHGIEAMIISAGGILETEERSISSIQTLPLNTYFIISCLKDIHLVDDSIKNIYGIYTSDFVINSILNQSTQVKQPFIITSPSKQISE